jgi:type IV fimbrial biogenesis protein FimT
MLMVVLIIALLATLAVPNFNGLLARNALNARVNEFIGALQMARTEAVTRNEMVTVCRRNSDGTDTCDTAGGWENGWLVFVDSNTSGAWDTGETIVGNGAAVSNMRFLGWLGNRLAISFRPNGTPRYFPASGSAVDREMVVCRGTAEYEAHVTIGTTGRPFVTTGYGYPYKTLTSTCN